MIVVTGGAGFIGSCIIAKLNALGREDIIVVDHWDAEGLKKKNLAKKVYFKFYDKEEFLDVMSNNSFPGLVTNVIHMGANSSTTGTDREFYIKNNFEYSCRIAEWAVKKNARFIYASSAATYGSGENGYSDKIDNIRICKPLNFYGESKQMFDQWVLDRGLYSKVVGLKFFNVFGPNEYHKGDMRSVVAKSYEKVVTEGRMSLFKSYRPEYAHGEQKRDFVYVKDAVDVVIFLLNHPKVNGIFNLGTGRARPWNVLAHALFAAVGKPPQIDYIDMPEGLREKYQYFTQAEMSGLRAAGYTKPFMSLEDAVKDYVRYLKDQSYF
ncbi:MAG: ADP-glyceromanno-heptose 6-epimerase [Candidatus Omnitrophica bacterium]|nr:ADP-glyceromanno-heptose 6-epimerase [Candidatus Omnitrophota bacterium]